MQINSLSNQLPPEQASSVASPSLGKDEFLMLLIEQISQQDPLNPLDDKEFVAQLAQFSSLEQALETNQHLTLLQTSQAAMLNAQVTSLVGRQATVQTDTLKIQDGQASPLGLTVERNAEQVSVEVVNSDGLVVRTMELGPRSAGSHTIPWEGFDQSGRPLPDGTYRLKVDAVNHTGGAVTARTQITGIVDSIGFENAKTELVIDGIRYEPSRVTKVGAATATDTAQP